MINQDTYVMLMSSLPRSEALFLAKQPPLSRIRLEQRLRILDVDDAETLRLVEDTLNWSKLANTMLESEVIDRGHKAIANINSDTLKAIIRERLEIRTAVVALRLRARGEGPPHEDIKWGFGRWVGHIRRNWTESGFRLDGTFPWIKEASRLMEQKDALGFERLILEQTYKRLQRHSQQHTFNLEAIVIYVLKWNIFDRWARANAEAAVKRFENLTLTGLGAYVKLTFEGDN